MSTDKKHISEIGSIFAIAVILMLVYFWTQTSNLNAKIQTLQNQQTAMLKTQMKLQAIAHILTPKQIEKLTENAFLGSVSAMDCLYIHYKGLPPSVNGNDVRTFVWGSVFYKFEKDAQSVEQLNEHYQSILSEKAFQSAESRIASIQKEINENVNYPKNKDVLPTMISGNLFDTLSTK